MSLSRIKAIIMQELYITQNSIEVMVDLFYYSIVTVIAWGFISLYLAGTSNKIAGHLLIGMILWEIIRIVQYSISVGALWNIWSKNLSNMFIAPLSLAEYMTAQLISGVVKALAMFLVISTLSTFLFNFNIFQLGIANLLIYFLNLTIFAWAIGLIILAFIFRYGPRIQALAWGLIFIFQPLTAVFFPVKILPTILQKLSYFIPATHIFEAARGNLTNPSINWNLISIAFLENIVYLIVSLWFFNFMFNKSKESGQFAKNEG
ncbi:MAG: ABC transporter permease [bacterium]|nr:ABC transporter permease [bacterium]